MVRNFLNVGLAINMVIMHLSVLKERKSIEESLDLGDIEIVCMLMKMKNHIRVELMMN